MNPQLRAGRVGLVPPNGGTDLLPIPGLEKTSAAFRDRLALLASELGLDASSLAAVMKLESGFNPAAVNPQSSATGLIQFLPSTAKILGTTVEELALMSAESQLEFVAKYFAPFRAKIQDEGDHYVAVFMPSLLGKPVDTIISTKGQKIYDQNAGLDVSRDGILTIRDVKARLERETQGARARLRNGGKPIAVDGPKEPAEGTSWHGPLFSAPDFSSSAPRRADLSPARDAALRRRFQRYFRNHSEGISPSQIRAWAQSVRRDGPFSHADIDHAIRSLIEDGEIARGAAGFLFKRGAPPAFGSRA